MILVNTAEIDSRYTYLYSLEIGMVAGRATWARLKDAEWGIFASMRTRTGHFRVDERASSPASGKNNPASRDFHPCFGHFPLLTPHTP
jgi:hypothetical protein